MWKCNRMSEENIENITKSGSSLSPTFADHHKLLDINFNGHWLINNNYTPQKVMYIYLPLDVYISYTLNLCLRNLNSDFTLNNCLCRSVNLTKNAGPEKYKYSSFSIGFNSRSEFSFTDGSMGKMSSILELI